MAKYIRLISSILLCIICFSCSREEPPPVSPEYYTLENKTLTSFLNNNEIDYVESAIVEKQKNDKYRLTISGFPAKGRHIKIKNVIIENNKFTTEFTASNIYDEMIGGSDHDYSTYSLIGEFLTNEKDKSKPKKLILNFTLKKQHFTNN